MHVSIGEELLFLTMLSNLYFPFSHLFFKNVCQSLEDLNQDPEKVYFGRYESRVQIFWMNWSDVCKYNKEEGLGVRDLRVVNLSILAK